MMNILQRINDVITAFNKANCGSITSPRVRPTKILLGEMEWEELLDESKKTSNFQDCDNKKEFLYEEKFELIVEKVDKDYYCWVA